ncbi:hypothetical protein PENPOL_c021G10365 [Penicillium polonicum]|uniref:Uncharacterized protein n=1 Tax=Penicillium polonicum TaxID=60169 RepID=A0A1V6N7W3_PENPO|nr:hypothetical protein PENPOL_c021G10365 [Penicillium polonicum]
MAETLPLETLRCVFSYLEGRLAPYACVCRQWQVAAEQLTFADLHINSADLEDFRQIALSSHSASRCFHVSHLYFKVILPEYSVTARGHYENRNDRDGNSKVFTQAITSLFEILSSWPDADRHQISLQIYAKSPSDWESETDWVVRRIRLQRCYAFPEQELLHRRYERSYLQLTEALPNVECITSLKVLGCGRYRNIAPGSVSEMVAHLPRLDTINAELRDRDRRGTAASDSLGDFPSAPWPSSLRHLRLECEASQRYGANLPPLANKSMCLALHRLTQQLKTVDLSQIMIDPEFFWPVNANGTTPSWPNLIKIDISYRYAGNLLYGPLQTFAQDSSKVSRDGSVVPRDDQQIPSRRLLSKQLDELYLAAGRAAQYMPKLDSMDLDISISNSSGSQHYFRYDATSGTATWMRSSDYHPSNEVQEAWDVAARGHGHAQMAAEFHSTEDSASDSNVSL